MENKILFTKEELSEMNKSYSQLALESLEKGDIEKAKYWINQNELTVSMVSDGLVGWIAGLLGEIYDRVGIEDYLDVLRSTLRHVAEQQMFMKDALIKEKGETEGFKETIRMLVDYLWKPAGAPFTVEEDEEKVIIKNQPCARGGKLIDAGLYEENGKEGGYRRVKEIGPHSYGKEDIPIYCTHCAILRIMEMELTGKPNYVWDPDKPFPVNSGDPCVHIFYKNTENMPEKYLSILKKGV